MYKKMTHDARDKYRKIQAELAGDGEDDEEGEAEVMEQWFWIFPRHF